MVSPVGRNLAGRGRAARRSWPSAFSGMVLLSAVAVFLLLGQAAPGQDDPLNQVHVLTPPPATAKADTAIPLTPGASLRSGIEFRVDTNLVLVPLIVTDPLDRLVTGLEKQNFTILEDNRPQSIRTFACDDAPVSVGVILDLSGSMGNKVVRARGAVLQFMKTSNPQDEFFVIGFNDRPVLITDFTSSADDVEARLATVEVGHRTALLDAMYFGLEKMKEAKYPRRALLVISDGGDNNSRYTENEVRSAVRESDVQIYSIGIFDPEAATQEERNGPMLLNEISNDSGGRLFRVDDLAEMGDIASRISAELRNEYVLGYKTTESRMDGKWRKVKVKLTPPPGLPQLTVHARTGYYAPLQ
ncbi:MAG TPA: VWA domain-containing protein [Acidobacteriaceae bacterium]|jgi:Ca-activated chloride channel family protein|nr:VWA domain-containing protein [Acidobacteriaceae bacterium]